MELFVWRSRAQRVCHKVVATSGHFVDFRHISSREHPHHDSHLNESSARSTCRLKHSKQTSQASQGSPAQRPHRPRTVPRRPTVSPINRAVTISTISVDRGLPIPDPTKLPPEPRIRGLPPRSRSRPPMKLPPEPCTRGLPPGSGVAPTSESPTTRGDLRGWSKAADHSMRPCSDETFVEFSTAQVSSDIRISCTIQRPRTLGKRARALPGPRLAHITRITG